MSTHQPSPAFLHQMGAYADNIIYIGDINKGNFAPDMKKHLLEGLQGELTFENVLVFMAILNEIQTKLSKLKTMENSFIEEVVKEEDTLCTSNLPKNLKESGYDYLDKEVITIYQTGLNQPMSQSDQTPIIDQQKALSRFEQEGRKRVEAYLQNNPSLQKYKDIVLLEDKKDLENDFYVGDEVFRYGELLEGVREEARTKEDLKNGFYRLGRRVFYQDKLIGIFR